MTTPVPADEADRVSMVRSLVLAGTPPEAAFDALAACAARIGGCAMGAVTVLDADTLWLKARVGFEIESMPRHGSFCAHAILGDSLFEVRDLRTDGRFHEHPLVTGAGLRYYAGFPIDVMDHKVGTLCVLDTVPRALAAADRELLGQLARTAAELLVSRRRLREAEGERQRLLDFGRAGGDWMWESDAEHRYQWLSASFEPMTGLSAGECLGREINDADVLGSDGAALDPPLRLRALLEQRQAFARTLTIKPSPRGPLYLSRSAVPKYDAGGRFAGYRGTIRNITSQIQAQQKLRERDQLLAKLGSQVPGVIFQYRLHPDGSTSFPYASERTRELLGTPAPAGGTGSEPSAPFRLMHPDDRAAFERSVAQSARRLQPLLHQCRIVRPDGSVRWLDTFATPERLPDGGTLWHGFCADITARRETEIALRRNEAQWELAASAAGIGLARLGLADGVVQLDARACLNHGLPHPAPRLTLSDWMNTIEPEDRRTAAAGVKRVLTDGSDFEGRYRVRRPDGQVRWLEFVVRATRGADEAIDGLTGICRDVHEQQTAAQMERARQEAERASFAKSQFLSRLSHELRTPLNGILGFAELMARDAVQPLQPRQAERLQSMRRAGTHLLGLIDDVLDISRTGAGEAPLRLRAVDLNAALDKSLSLLMPLALERRIELRRPALAPEAPTMAQAERRRLEQVMGNLLSNAIKFSAPGSCVTLNFVTQPGETGLAVRDEGPGLDAEQRARLFQPFDRLGAERLHVEGIGLGLFMARQLAEAMGGRIEVDSAPGQGSTFTLWLATAATAATVSEDVESLLQPADFEATPAHAASAPSAMDAAGPAAAQRQIVYIEDESLNQLLLQEMLRSRPEWHLHIAGDGASGLRLVRGLLPDLLLIDINLPDTNGLALVRQLRADPVTRHLRCIALSADAMHEQIRAALAAGFDDYWTKPLSVSRVLAAFDTLLAPPG